MGRSAHRSGDHRRRRGTLLGSRYRFTQPQPASPIPLETQCLGAGDITINREFYRTQPHEQRRYVALALDNIRRGPGDYARSVAYRALRLFVIVGTTDRSMAQQFQYSSLGGLWRHRRFGHVSCARRRRRLGRLAKGISGGIAIGPDPLSAAHHFIRAHQHAVHDYGLTAADDFHRGRRRLRSRLREYLRRGNDDAHAGPGPSPSWSAPRCFT